MDAILNYVLPSFLGLAASGQASLGLAALGLEMVAPTPVACVLALQ